MAFVTITILVLIKNIKGTALHTEYLTDFVFTLNDSPYYVNDDVNFKSSVLIPNGIEIIFNGDYNIIFESNIDCGCYDINTKHINDIGLADTSQYIYFHSSSTIQQGSIIINSTNNVNKTHFCNTKFDTMREGINFLPTPSSLIGPLIDNCIFNNINGAGYSFGIRVRKPNALITDSHFMNNQDYDITCSYDNVWTFPENLEIIHNKFEYNHDRSIDGGDCGVNLQIYNNTFINNIGDDIIDPPHRGHHYIGYNEFVNNTIYYSLIWTPTGGTSHIEYNSFINNMITSESTTFSGLLKLANDKTHLNYNTFINNFVAVPWLINQDLYVYFYCKHNTFINNKISKSVIGIRSILYVYIHHFEIENNLFYSNSIQNNVNTYIHAQSQLSGSKISYNRFYNCDNIDYFIALIPNTYAASDILTEDNYFDGLNIDDISRKIYDSCDDSQLGIVKLSSWYTYRKTQILCSLNTTFTCDITSDDAMCDTVNITFVPATTTSITTPTSVPTTNVKQAKGEKKEGKEDLFIIIFVVAVVFVLCVIGNIIYCFKCRSRKLIKHVQLNEEGDGRDVAIAEIAFDDPIEMRLDGYIDNDQTAKGKKQKYVQLDAENGGNGIQIGGITAVTAYSLASQ